MHSSRGHSRIFFIVIVEVTAFIRGICSKARLYQIMTAHYDNKYGVLLILYVLWYTGFRFRFSKKYQWPETAMRRKSIFAAISATDPVSNSPLPVAKVR